MFQLIVAATLVCSALSFKPANTNVRSTALSARSKAVPFLDQPAALTGTLPGDVGFDPLNLSGQWSDVSFNKRHIYSLFCITQFNPSSMLDKLFDMSWC